MRIIKISTLKAFWEGHSEAEASLRTWVKQVKASRWRAFADVQKTFPGADQMIVSSGRTVVVFNIAHNRYRLVAAVHYNMRIVYTLMGLTHKDYVRNTWKNQL
jgi:mRNA interferase HigB